MLPVKQFELDNVVLMDVLGAEDTITVINLAAKLQTTPTDVVHRAIMMFKGTVDFAERVNGK